MPLTIGPAIVAVAFLLFARPGVSGDYWTTFFPAAVVLGLGMAITVPPLTTAVLSAAPEHQAGVASGINNAVARTAGLLAVALFGVLVTTAFDQSLDGSMDRISALSPALRAAVEDQSADLAAAQAPPEADAEMTAAINSAIDASFVRGFRLAMIAGAALALLSAVVAWKMIAGLTPSNRLSSSQP